MPELEVENLSVKHRQKVLLEPISFRVAGGETLTIVGETGAGKSLLAQAMLGVLPAGLTSTGKIWLDGTCVGRLGPRQRAALWGRQVAMLPQEPWRALSPLMWAGRQVRETYRHVAGSHAGLASDQTAEDFRALGLTDAGHKIPQALSGGMAQRVAFAATRAGGAPVLIADEPTKGLDFETREQIADMLARVPRDGGTLLTITHELALVRRLGGRILVLRGGKLMESGPARDVLERPRADYTRELLEAAPSHWRRPPSAARTETLLRASGLEVSRGGRALVSNFFLNLKIGEKAAISGRSGVGKSSLLDTLAGLNKPSAGSVRYSGLVAPTGVQKIYQDPPAAFAAHMCLGTAISDVTRLHGVDWSVIDSLLSQLNVDPKLLERRPDAVSGGELQRIALVRALCIMPQILLADEPTSRLDPITQRKTMDVIAETTGQRGIAVVLVTHHREIAENWADRHIRLG